MPVGSLLPSVQVSAGTLKMRVRKMRVLESASTLVSMENASTEYASTQNMGTKVLSQDNASTENAGSDNAGTADRPGKCEYGIC
jgi:hypothetical protein